MQPKVNKNLKEIGYIFSFFSGVAKIKGLPHVFLHEVLVNGHNEPAAVVIGFNIDFVQALFFDEYFDIKKPVFRSNEIFSISLSSQYSGRVLDGLGRPLDGLGPITGRKKDVFQEAIPLIQREPVSTPLFTGIKILDTTLPIGRGQRELIIGDRKLGKSTITKDIIINQKKVSPKIHCVYVICGQNRQELYDTISLFKKHDAFLYTTIIAATSDDSFANLYLAPFTGCTICEYFRDQGQDTLIIYDDLSKHAKAYRDISLLLQRAPGREAYPGDIFSLHAELLERAGNISPKHGGGSLTALPIIQTQQGDITSFIPTNIVSITDGQIYLERGLFQKNFLPAINIGLSVSRIGSQAQSTILKNITEGIRLSLAQYKELQKLSQLESAVSEQTQQKIQRGSLTLELLKQKKHTFISMSEQSILFHMVKSGFFDKIETTQWEKFETLLLDLLKYKYPKLLKQIKEGKFNKNITNKINKIFDDFKNEFLSN